MLPTTRYVQILPLLCAVGLLTQAFPTQTPSDYDDVQSLQVNIPHLGELSAPLGSSISIPCLVTLSSTPTTTSSSPIVPRVKWSVVSGTVETQILVARGQRVKINEAYQYRAALPNYTSSLDDLSLLLGDLRSSDSGHYRCEVQQGLEDASDLVQLDVKGVVFHYRDALGRYAFTYHQAQTACEAIGAEIATPDQLLAAYYDGYEQCDAGWLADQSVRYPIQEPRKGCYGDMDGQPGVRNYGTMDADDLFDVYCYVEQIEGEVFHESVPQQLSFDAAQSYCRDRGAELATTAQLYSAWSEGLDRCSPGWLSDGSVRYPIVTPRERCGGPQAGVKTLYRFSNQTGFPETSSLHDVYCFKGSRNTPTHSPMDYVATKPVDIGQGVVILTETYQELQLNQHAEQVEREAQSALESFQIISSLSTEQYLFDTHTTVTSDTTESPLNTTVTMDPVLPFDETSTSAGMSSDSQHPIALTNSTIISTETLNFPQNASLLSDVSNETDSHQNMNFTVHSSDLESTTESPKLSYAPYTLNQTMPDTPPTTSMQLSVNLKESQATQQVNLDLNQANHTNTDSNSTLEENILHVFPVTPDSEPEMKLEEAAVEDLVQMSLSTQLPIEETELRTQTTQSTIKEITSLWPLLDGSGDTSQEIDLDIKSATSVSSSSSITIHPSVSASASSTTAESQTAITDAALSTGSQNIDKLGFNILSTIAHMWESAISRQEGSTSSETNDLVTMEIEDKQLYQTTSDENLVSGVSLATREPLGRSNTSQLPTDSTKTEYRTSGYREYWDTATAVYEESSGQEPGVVTAILVETDEVGPAFEEDLKVSQIPEDEVTVPTLEEEFKDFQTLEEDPKDYFSLEKEATVAPTVAVEKEPLTFEEGANLMPPIEEESNPIFEKETKITPTLEEDLKVALTLALEEETSVPPTLALEEEAKVGTMLEDEVGISPSFEKEANIVLTDVEETSVPPTIEDEANHSSSVEEEAKIAPTYEEEATNAPPIEEDIVVSTLVLKEEAKGASTIQEDFTIFPLHSLTSNWPLLTTTTGPQESLNDLEYSKKSPSFTSRTSPDSTSTRSSAATTKTTTISTTTHLPRHTWSPTTTTRIFHKMTEPQKVTHIKPPVNQGLVDIEFSLTQPPTLLILPNERAAVGGAGKASDACVDNPCLNGGTCVERDGQIQCLCLPTYEGNFCQTDLEQCEPGWDKFHGFCYRHFSQRLSWEVAEKHCRVLGAHLVSIMSPEEQSYLNSNYKEYQWTGLNDKTIEDDFRWSDGNPLLFENWYRGQPDSYFLSGEDCVVMVWHDDGRWSDVPCNYHLAYTCKKGTSSCGPPPKVRNASLYGKVRQRYETSAIVRYYCAKDFQQKLNPLIRCLPGGRWERPQILCIPETGILNEYAEANSKFAMTEDEFQATEETPQYWDIKF